MNNINLIGRTTADIELKKTSSGKSVATFNLAVDRPHTKDTTDFIPIIAWEQKAEFLSKYAHKGNRIGITGTLTSRTYDKDGKKVTAYEVIADNVELLEKKDSTSTPMTPVEDNEELPF